MKCPKCGHENVAGAKFCIECGFAVSGVESDLETDRSLGDDATIMTPGATADPTSATSPTSPQYEILKPLGQGGMGVVYLARDTRLDIEVAIKRLAGDMADRDRSVHRFLTEARSIAQLNHQNIVRVNTVGEDAEGHFIVMEFIDGPDLDELIRRQGKLTVPDALELFRAICNGVSYAHTRGVIHRDIKPSNIIMSAGRIPKLVDFGLARIGRESDVSMTGYGLGTMSYMSPEQKRDAKHVDHRSDIFALAKTLYFMVTGKDPDTVDYDLIPAAIREPLLRAMKPDPADRYFMVDQFLADIDLALSAGPDPENLQSDSRTETVVANPEPPTRLRRMPVVVVSGLAVALTTFGIWQLVTPEDNTHVAVPTSLVSEGIDDTVAEPVYEVLEDLPETVQAHLSPSLPKARLADPTVPFVGGTPTDLVLRVMIPEQLACSVKSDAQSTARPVIWPEKPLPLPTSDIEPGVAYVTTDGFVVYWGASDHFILMLSDTEGVTAMLNGYSLPVVRWQPGQPVVIDLNTLGRLGNRRG